MRDTELSCYVFPDVLPWERAGLAMLFEQLGRLHAIDVVEVSPKGKPPKPRGRKVWVIAHEWQAALRKLRPSRKSKVYISVMGTSISSSALPVLFLNRFRPLLSPAWHLLTHSPLSFRFFKELMGVDEKQVSFLWFPFATENAPRVPAPNRKLTVGTLSRFTSESNLNYFLNVAHCVAQQNPDIRFQILGTGPLGPHVSEMIRELSLTDTVFLDDGPTPMSVSMLDLLLYVPLRNDHFLPILLAGKYRVPVLASELPGIGDFVTDGKSGFILPVNETRPMADLVLRLAADESLRHSMGDALSRDLNEKFPETLMTEGFERLFFPAAVAARQAA